MNRRQSSPILEEHSGPWEVQPDRLAPHALGLALPHAAEGYSWVRFGDMTDELWGRWLLPSRLPSAYRQLDDAWLVAKSSAMRTSSFLAVQRRKELLREVRTLSLRAEFILRFADEYGSLTGGPEPLRFWVDEFETIQTLSDTARQIRTAMAKDGDPVARDQAQDELLQASPFDQTLPERAYVRHGLRPHPKGERRNRAIDWHWRQIALTVSERLQLHTQTVLRPTFEKQRGIPQARLLYVPSNLLGAIYMALAFELAGITAGLKACGNPNCPNDGIIRGRRKDYCTDYCRKDHWRQQHPRPRRPKGASNGTTT